MVGVPLAGTLGRGHDALAGTWGGAGSAVHWMIHRCRPAVGSRDARGGARERHTLDDTLNLTPMGTLLQAPDNSA